MFKKPKFNKKKLALSLAFLGVGILGLTIGMNIPRVEKSIADYQNAKKNREEASKIEKLTEEVSPKDGFTLPISWGELGPKLVAAGVIDEQKFNEAVNATNDQKKILAGGVDAPVKIDSTNSQFVVDFLWAIGLAQKSVVYEEGPMGREYKNDQGNFASTGGWTLARGDAMQYLNKFDLISLTPEQQNRVKDIAMNVYRPCCDNSTWFPDCNHGMAALAAIEMMVAKNLPDEEVYRNVLKLNSFWFPDAYLTIAFYFDGQGTSWDKVDAKKVLGKDFSSATGAQRLQSIVGPLPGRSTGGSCGA